MRSGEGRDRNTSRTGPLWSRAGARDRGADHDVSVIALWPSGAWSASSPTSSSPCARPSAPTPCGACPPVPPSASRHLPVIGAFWTTILGCAATHASFRAASSSGRRGGDRARCPWRSPGAGHPASPASPHPVGRRSVDPYPQVGHLWVTTSIPGDQDLMLPVVVVEATVEHLAPSGLDVDHQQPVVPVGEGHRHLPGQGPDQLRPARAHRANLSWSSSVASHAGADQQRVHPPDRMARPRPLAAGVVAVLTALDRRRRTGRGCHIDPS